MLISYEYQNSGLLLSYIDKQGALKYKTPNQMPWSRVSNWTVTAPNDPDRDHRYHTWDGRPVKQVYTRMPNRYSVFEFISEAPQDVLDDVFAFTSNAPIYFVDIETKKGKDGYSEPEDATEPVTLITVCKGNKLLVMGVQPLELKEMQYVTQQVNNYMRQFEVEMETRFKWYSNESAMLHAFFTAAKTMPIITGWNFDGYDWPYLTNRFKRFGGSVNICSPVGRTEPFTVRTRSKTMTVDKPVHKLIVDYMELYQKWGSPKLTRESSKLDYVADKTLGARKIEYDQDLEHLMRTDYKKYVYYGAVDTILVQLIHKKMQYFNIMASISVLSRIRMQDALSTVAVTEGYLRKPLKENENIVFVKSYEEKEDVKGLAGGWVMHPIRGLVPLNACNDFNSLYPTTQRIFNIAAETYKGVLHVVGDQKNVMTDSGQLIPLLPTDITTADLNDDPKNPQYAVFSNSDDSTTKKMLSTIYSDRKKHKKMMIDASMKLKDTEDRIKYLEKLMV